ncbi:MAG: hypothetical protein ACRCSB_02470 [Bacteroidales bacterium]
MEFIVSFILIILLIGYIGKALIFLFINRFIKQVVKREQKNQKKTPPPRQIIPNEVGEYIDFEEIQKSD